MLNVAPPHLSVIVPLFNERPNIEPLFDEICEAMRECDRSWEIIFIDDGSTDGSGELLDDLASRESRLRVLTQPLNRGQGSALYLGFKEARGQIVVTMDGDRQNHPGDIPELLRYLEPGTDMVVGVRRDRQDSPLRRRMSRTANAVRGWFLGDGLTDSGCALKVMRRSVIDSLIPLKTLYSFIPALAIGGGHTVAETEVTHRPRVAGASSYGLRTMLWRPLVDMLGIYWFNRRRSDRIPARATNAVSFPFAVAFLAAVCSIFLLLLDNHGLLEPDEGRYAEVAREMSASGNYLIPTLNGFDHLEKPPLIYWLTALSYKTAGTNEFAARMPSALAAIGTVLLTFSIGTMLSSRRAGLIAAVVLASCCEFFFLARTLTPDMTMCFWITASIAALLRHSQQYRKRSLWSWLFFVCAGIGFLTKGPVAFLVPGCAAIGLRWSRRHAEIPLRGVPWIGGVAVALGIGLSWFAVATWRHPELYRYFVYDEFLHRIGSGTHGRSQPVWFFVPIAIAGFLPWTALAPFLVQEIWRRRNGRMGEAASQTVTFLLWWTVPAFLVLSVSGSKLLTYILPLFPAVAIAVGIFLHHRILIDAVPRRTLCGIATALASLCAIFVLVLQIGSGGNELVTSCSVLAILFASILAISLIIQIKGPVPFMVAVGTLICLSWLGVSSQTPRLNNLLAQQATVKPIAASLMRHPDFRDARIIASNVRAHGLEFYLGREVEMTKGQASLAFAPPAHKRKRLHRNSKAVARIESCSPVFVLTRSGDAERHFLQWEKLTQAGDFVLLYRQSRCPPRCVACSGRSNSDSGAGRRSRLRLPRK